MRRAAVAVVTAVLAVAMPSVVAVIAPGLAGAGAAAATHSRLLPPENPAHALAVDEYLWPSCTGPHDDSAACIESSLAMLNAGRRAEGLGPLILPANWERLTVAEQLFVLTELERTARGPSFDSFVAGERAAAAQLCGRTAGDR